MRPDELKQKLVDSGTWDRIPHGIIDEAMTSVKHACVHV